MFQCPRCGDDTLVDDSLYGPCDRCRDELRYDAEQRFVWGRIVRWWLSFTAPTAADG